MSSVAVVNAVSGEASALRGGQAVPLGQGSSLEAGDILLTGDGATLTIRFNDDSVIELRELTRVQVKDFLFEPQEQSFTLHIMEGVLRSVSGKIVEQNPEAFSITSPLGVVGIRGTETQHIISPKFEVHSVLFLGAGHTVFIRTADGRIVIISESLKGVIISLGDETPLQLFDITKELLEEYLQQLKSQGYLQDDPSGYFVLGDAAFLAGLGAMDLTSLLAFLPAERLDALLTGLGELDAQLSPLLANMLNNTGIYQLFTGTGQSYTGSGLNDTLILNGGGHNTLHAGSGDDTILVLSGNGPGNMLMGGHGSWDYIYFEQDTRADTVFGDESTMPFGARGDDDVIEVAGLVDNDSFLYGDAEFVSAGGSGPLAYGGNDTIIVHGNMYGGIVGDFSGYTGDILPQANIVCGNDIILIQGDMISGGTIYGDAMRDVNVSGHDTIHIRGSMTGGVIYGDYNEQDGGTAGGNDVIVVGGAVSILGSIYGGAGNDSISVGGVNSGAIYGGAGNDTIFVGGLGDAGKVYAEAGNDSIVVGTLDANTMGDSPAGCIDAGSGNDTLEINSYDLGDVPSYCGGSCEPTAGETDNDLFVFAQPTGDVKVMISNFGTDANSVYGQDTLDLRAFGAGNVAVYTDSIVCTGASGTLTIFVSGTVPDEQLILA